jgi:transcriptional regulator with XRE-family HTH domain
MPTALSSALAAKVTAGKLSIAALAKAIGASIPSVTTALKSKSFPNASTAPKFAKFLGIAVEALRAMKRGKAKPAAKSASKAEPAEAKPTKPATPTRTSMGITLAEAADLAADELAVSVHGATAEQRRIITAVLGD